MKKIFVSAFLIMSAACGIAQDAIPAWINNVKLSGYGMVQYQASDQEGKESNSFNLRMLRLSLEGRVVDLFAEWQKYKAFRVKVGQFKRAFTFENPMHPVDQGFMSYSQNVSKLAGFSDRAGGHASNGRDIGVQFQGDIIKNAAGRELLHYQVGVYNGQGINVKDVDQRKDVIGGVWVMPVKGMRLGVFGWEGSYARDGKWTAEDGTEKTGVRSLNQHRYAISGEYVVNDWTFRSEYIHSTGEAFAKSLVNTNDANSKDCNLSSLGYCANHQKEASRKGSLRPIQTNCRLEQGSHTI